MIATSCDIFCFFRTCWSNAPGILFASIIILSSFNHTFVTLLLLPFYQLAQMLQLLVLTAPSLVWYLVFFGTFLPRECQSMCRNLAFSDLVEFCDRPRTNQLESQLVISVGNAQSHGQFLGQRWTDPYLFPNGMGGHIHKLFKLRHQALKAGLFKECSKGCVNPGRGASGWVGCGVETRRRSTDILVANDFYSMSLSWKAGDPIVNRCTCVNNMGWNSKSSHRRWQLVSYSNSSQLHQVAPETCCFKKVRLSCLVDVLVGSTMRVWLNQSWTNHWLMYQGLHHWSCPNHPKHAGHVPERTKDCFYPLTQWIYHPFQCFQSISVVASRAV